MVCSARGTGERGAAKSLRLFSGPCVAGDGVGPTVSAGFELMRLEGRTSNDDITICSAHSEGREWLKSEIIAPLPVLCAAGVGVEPAANAGFG